MSGAVEFDKSVRISKFTLKLTGLRLGEPKLTWSDYIKNTWLFYFNLFFLYTDIIAEIIWIAEKVNTGISFNEVTFILPCVTISVLASVKSFYVLVNEKYVIHILTRLKQLHPNLKTEDDNIDKSKGVLYKIVDDAMKLLNLVINILSYTNAFLFVAVVFTPVIIMIVIYFTSGRIVTVYPILTSYPYINSSDIKAWPAIYVHQCWSGAIALLSLIGSDTLFYAFCTFIHIQFKILGHQIAIAIKRDRRNGNSEVDGNVPVPNEFRDVILYHQELIDLVLQVDKIYSKSTLFNFITSSILICLCGFNLTMVQDVPNIASFLVFLITSLSQIFIICYFGDMITRSSMEVRDAVYNSDWFEASNTVKKNMILMIFRSQKACKLTAYKFADINLQAFTTVLSRSWSYFALLKTIYS